MKVIIFGTGRYAEDILTLLDRNIEVVAFSDNNKDKWWTYWKNKQIIPPREIEKYIYDYIIIASMYTNEIIEGLINIGIDVRKVICVNDEYFNQLQRENDFVCHRLFLKRRIKKIALISWNKSGCNANALYKQIPEHIKKEFIVDLVEHQDYKQLIDYDVFVTTHFNICPYPGKINIDLWHGFPIKKIGIMNEYDNREKKNLYDKLANKIHLCASYSNLYTILLSSCSKINADRFRVTGMPRNDLLISKNSKRKLEDLLNLRLEQKKVIFYVPTFRLRKDKGIEVQEGSNLDKLSIELKGLKGFLEDNNLVFIIKKHAIVDDDWDIEEQESIYFLKDEKLKEADIDFYEILGAADLLVTDYSSVYFDFLLLDKPIIFYVKDYEKYKKSRGLLLEPFDFWTPGPKVASVIELKKEIRECLENKNYFKDERDQICKLVHFFTDFNSSERVWGEIHKKIKEIESES